MSDTNGIELIDFVDLKTQKKLMVLHWRNHDDIRQWMYRSDLINTQEHLQFIDSLQHDETKKYFLVEEGKSGIGVIYFTNIDKQKSCTEFGIYLNPSVQGKGAILMQEVIYYAFKRLQVKSLVAEVFADNKRAISRYLKSGFKHMDRYRDNTKEIIIMELKNDNR